MRRDGVRAFTWPPPVRPPRCPGTYLGTALAPRLAPRPRRGARPLFFVFFLGGGDPPGLPPACLGLNGAQGQGKLTGVGRRFSEFLEGSLGGGFQAAGWWPWKP